MVTRVYAKHEPYTDGHLGMVTEEMRQRGAPTIRVMRFNGELYATEASHRLASAHAQGIEPNLVIELEDVSAVPDEHWLKVTKTLPCYDFEHVHVLDLKEF
jgi:hypothetical protein